MYVCILILSFYNNNNYILMIIISIDTRTHIGKRDFTWQKMHDVKYHEVHHFLLRSDDDDDDDDDYRKVMTLRNVNQNVNQCC